MSDEQQDNIPKNPKPTSPPSSEDERKKQFEKMKDRFGKKTPNPFGGSGNSGGNGGNFAPSLFLGSYTGFFFSKLINLSGFTKLPISNFTMVGMAGILSGLFHAPLTAIFLIAEITGGYELMIPLMCIPRRSRLGRPIV